MLNKHNNGFTLIEVLIAVIVLAMGLLGFAALQAMTLRNSQSAYNRSLATQLAYDIADRMRANSSSVGGQYLSVTMTPDAAAAQPNCLTTTGCSPTAMAENDLYEWNQRLNALPDPHADISAAGGIYTISIDWDDNKNGVRDDPVFSMSFSL